MLPIIVGFCPCKAQKRVYHVYIRMMSYFLLATFGNEKDSAGGFICELLYTNFYSIKKCEENHNENMRYDVG